MSEALFLRLLPYDDKSVALTEAINAVQEGCSLNSDTYVVDPVSFSQIPGSTFAYWVSNAVFRLFSKFEKFESEKRSIRVGLQTSDDFRFVRLSWEVPSREISMGTPETTLEQYRQQTYQGRYWIPLAKGGAYSPYYSDIHLLVNWERDAEDLKNFKDSHTGKPISYLRNAEFYFIQGLTWSARTTSTLREK